MQSRLTEVLLSKLLATPTVVFWLWLVIVPARLATVCPEECDCDTKRYQVLCLGKSIKTVPLFNLTDVRKFGLYENNINLIESDSFVLLTELQLLNIWMCGLKRIELGAFNGLQNLKKLEIGSNRISEIIPGTFKDLNNLEILDLSYNGLDHLDTDVFSGLLKLRRVHLMGNNLHYLHPDTFLGLPNIKHIALDKNPGLKIPTDRNFINSQSLSRLDIAECVVSSLSVETFANVSALEWLDLMYNNLRSLDINILKALPKISKLYLNGNPLHCGCQLQEVRRWCEGRKIRTVHWEKVPQCDTPSEVKGMCWGVLEEGQCLEGNIQYSGDYRNTSYSYADTTG